ncbi:MAG TPA: hypothetical protein PKC43_01405 [Phycisphaerales bacterium]|nr:hypothetical protein [Phycisphaerales bacterium]HMP36082.1 hypothetical protein [Phycisphaerales bacterium]
MASLVGAAAPAFAQVVAPPGFAVDVLFDQIDGSTPRLESISNPAYGSGLVAANLNAAGILTVFRLSPSGVEVIGVRPGFLPAATGGSNAGSSVLTIRFDRTGLFGHKLHLSVRQETATSTTTQFFVVEPGGAINSVLGPVGGPSNKLAFLFEFTEGGGYLPGAYLEDQNIGNGTSLWHASPGWQTTVLGQNVLPPGRTDLDIYSMRFDTTGVYGNRLLLADSDNDDNKTVIYALLPNLTWTELTAVVPLSTRFYRDMDISVGGALGAMIYVAEQVSQQVQTVDADGAHAPFATGFTGIGSIAAAEDGNALFVSDANAIYRIRPAAAQPGPTILCHDPNAGPQGVFTNPAGLSSARIIFDEPVLFSSGDVSVLNEAGMPVPFSVVGSNTRFMLIGFGVPLVNDVYTITVADSVVSVAGGVPIDGNGDGVSGGAATVTLEHRRRADIDDDGDVDSADLGLLLGAWGG